MGVRGLLEDNTVVKRNQGQGNSIKKIKGKTCSGNSDCDGTDKCLNGNCAETWLLKVKDGICADAYQRNTNGGTVKTYACNSDNLNQQWSYDHEKQRIKNING